MRDIKDYLHLYLGCEVFTGENPYVDGHLVMTGILGNSTQKFRMLGIGMSVTKEFDLGKHKIALRPLSDMTEEEKVECFDNHARLIKDIKAIEGFTPKQFIYLLSKHFDIFNLIPEGLAIDKTKKL